MTDPLVAWTLAGLALAAAAILAFRVRALAASAAEASESREKAKAKLHALERRFEQRDKDRKGRGDELAELRRKLDKARRRASRAREDQQSDSVRIRQLEEDLRIARANVRAAHSEPTDAPRRDERETRGTAPAPAAPPIPLPAAPAAESVEASAELVSRAEAAEAASERWRSELSEGKRELAKLRHDLERARTRIATQDKLYVAIRGELGAKKDRLRRQQEELERLLALKVVVNAPPEETPDDQPPASSA